MIVRTPGSKLRSTKASLAHQGRIGSRPDWDRLLVISHAEEAGHERTLLAEERLHLDPTRSCSLQSIFRSAGNVNRMFVSPTNILVPWDSYTSGMDRLWTPWRYAYITGAKQDPAPGVPPALSAWLDAGEAGIHRNCVFCNMIAAVDYAVSRGMPAGEASREALIVERSDRTFVCLNRFPYSTGHLLVVPYQHCDSLSGLEVETALEIMITAQRVDAALRRVYRPDGLNFGLNLGEAAGAGVASHLHLHALPRWSGDTNFMTVTAETRILPETLDVTWQKMRDALR